MEFFKTLHQANQAASEGLDLKGRAFMPYLAVVTNNDDPTKARRVKAAAPTSPGTETHWLRRLSTHPNLDPPLPKIGQTILVMSIDGDPLNGWWMICVNAPNPPHDKPDPQLDFSAVTEGRQDERTDGDRVINVGQSLTLRNDAGASITLADNGNVIITDGSGNSINLAGAIAFSTSSLSVGGKQITTLGAVDTGGDSLATKGW